jgi:hypothetical protein
MPLIEIVNSSVFRTVNAYNQFVAQIHEIFDFHDVWLYRSLNPCLFCRTMQQISLQVFIPPGGAFPAPNFTIQNYLSALDLTYVEFPPAHDNCQCIRVTEPRVPMPP